MNWNNGMKWIVVVFAVLVLMSVFVGAASAEEIPTITLTGVIAPVAGQAPQTSGISVSENNLTVGTYEWKTESGGSVGQSFDYNTVYKLIIPITVKDTTNNTLVDSPTVIPEGGNYDAGKVTITFPKTAELKTISETVTITLTPPATGESKSNPSSLQHTKATVSWTPALSNDKFSGGQSYTATITVTADTGYIFSDAVSVKLNNADVTKELSSDKKSLTVIKEFPTTEQTETILNTVNINITAPAAGATPATSVSGTNIVSESVTWSPSVSSTFASGTQYSATIKVRNATGYKLNSTPTVTVNGNSVVASKVSVSGNILTVSNYIIGTTSGEISSVSLTVDAPVLGAKPDTDTDVSKESSAKYDVSSITWYENSVSSSNKINTSDTFAEKTTYIAEIKLTADAGYLFNSSMKKESAKVNTKAASKDPTISTDKKELTLQYTFPATGEAQKPVITITAEPANPVIKSGLDSVAVKFTYKITGDYDSASLNFGDNSEVSITQSGGTESHTYTSASTFTVTMRAGNENGTTTKTLSLPIIKEQFKASFDASLLSGEAPLKVLFTDTSTGTSGKLIQRSWDFDDGTTAAAQTSVTHTFEKEGTYYVRLFISDGVNQHTATKTITVTKKGGDDKVKIDVDYEPFIIIGDVGVPSPFDLIAEFVRLIQAMLNFDNYTFSGENSES